MGFESFVPVIGSALQAGGSLLGGAIGASGQQSSNAQMMAFNAQQAQENRDWQERMSNTAYQRAMADMRRAGLNPILAANLGGASTPGGGIGSVTLGNPGGFMQQGIQSASGVGQAYGQIKQAMAASAKDNSQTNLNDATTSATKASEDATRANIVLTNAGVDRTKQETATSAANAEAARASAAASSTTAANNLIQAQILQHGVTSAKADARLKQLEVDAAEKGGVGTWGNILNTIGRASRTALGHVVEGAGKLTVPGTNTPVFDTKKPGMGGGSENPLTIDINRKR